jgi:hypothetical protein
MRLAREPRGGSGTLLQPEACMQNNLQAGPTFISDLHTPIYFRACQNIPDLQLQGAFVTFVSCRDIDLETTSEFLLYPTAGSHKAIWTS